MASPDSSRLPVDDVLPDVVRALDDGTAVVLQAPPGAGKTTKVPPALLDRPWLGGDRIVMLEPRRLAARASARRIAQLLDVRLGGLVGYVTRDDRKVSRDTRLEVVTEGVLVRRLQRDPGLAGIGAVILDEFHERSLDADLALALSREVQQALRDDLRLVVMSATLEAERVSGLLDGAPVIRSEGRQYAVETRYRPRPDLGAPVEPEVADAVVEVLDGTDGDVLVFLPGAREIRRTADRLEERLGGGRFLVAPLFGALPPAEQDRALDPAPAGVRKIVLATDIAETSLTIEGVRVVVDAGLARQPRFDPRTGMSQLVTVRVSRASADQRRGRAGRVAPGVCVRLWSEAAHASLDAHTSPEIAQADLAGFALEIAKWGADDPSELALLDQPPEAAYEQAVALLRDLDAIDADGRITDHGQSLADLPLHPRLAHMVAAAPAELTGLACDVAALLAERDVLITRREAPCADLAVRLRLLRGQGRAPAGTSVRKGTLHRVKREAKRLRRAARADRGGGDPERAGEVLALAYPDRVAQARGARGSFLLAGGRGGTLPEGDVLAGEDLLVVASVDRGQRDAWIQLAAAIDESSLRHVLGEHVVTEEVVTWDDQARDVVAERQERLGAVVLKRAPLNVSRDHRAVEALLDGIRAEGLDLLPWTRELNELRERVEFLRRELGEEWPDLSDEALLDDLSWLEPFLAGCTSRASLANVPLDDALTALLGWNLRRRVDDLAPTHLRVPTGSNIRLDYSGEVPVLAVRLQELFGATRTPTVAGGKVPVMLHLLSPAHRPVQVTQDLAGFWERAYPDVRSELRGRYPKHPWPEDPLTAAPTRRTKRRS